MQKPRLEALVRPYFKTYAIPPSDEQSTTVLMEVKLSFVKRLKYNLDEDFDMIA
jgi:hypothetical protein